MRKLLIVEDDPGIQTQLKWGLSETYEDCEVFIVSNRQEALRVAEKEKPEVVTLDLGLPPDEDGATEGLACLKGILKISHDTKVIVVTGNEDRENALFAVGLGAYDFYQKPIDMEVLKIILQRAFRLVELEREYTTLKENVAEANVFENMVGYCPEMQEVFETVKKVATTDATILIGGASGTGKELVASAVHQRSLRRKKPLVVINCGAIPETLLESELFGHEKGAFTDAKSRKIGLIEKAQGGTLFLDEIGELTGHLQVKLLRFTQERTIQRLGGMAPIDVDVRLIAATNVDLENAVNERQFRKDLFFRISVIQVSLPELKDRGDDLSLLARTFLTRFTRENNKKFKGFTSRAIAALRNYDWPGNVRELENKIQRAVIMSDGPVIDVADLAFSEKQQESFGSELRIKTLKEARARAEIDIVQQALMQHNGNVSKAARELQVSRPTLHELLKKYGLTVSECC